MPRSIARVVPVAGGGPARYGMPVSEQPFLRPASLDETVEVFCDAFAGYAVMRFVLGAASDGPERLRRLVHLFVSNRALRGDPLLVVDDAGTAIAGMTMTLPRSPERCDAFAALAATTWQQLGDDARLRYATFAAASDTLYGNAPDLHVNMLGVRAGCRQRGLARRLLDEAHRRSAADPDSTGVTLTTENPANVPFYLHLGYEVVGYARIDEGFESWGLFRPDQPA